MGAPENKPAAKAARADADLVKITPAEESRRDLPVMLDTKANVPLSAELSGALAVAGSVPEHGALAAVSQALQDLKARASSVEQSLGKSHAALLARIKSL
jgi:hypothetical protein